MKIKRNYRIILIASGVITIILLGIHQAIITYILPESELYNNLFLIIPLLLIISLILFYSFGAYISNRIESLNELKYAATFANSTDIIVITRLNDGIIIDINESGLNALGKVKSEVIGKTTLDLGVWINPQEREWLYHTLRNDGKVTDFQVELNQNGVQKFFSLSSVVLELEGEKSIITFAKDITELKAAENVLKKAKSELEVKIEERTRELARINEELKNEMSEHTKMELALTLSEEKYRSLVQQLPVGVYRTGIDGTLIHINKALANILGFESEDELMQYNALDFFIDKNIRDEYINQLRQSKNDVTYNYKLKKLDGSIIWVHDKAHAVYNTDGVVKYLDGIIEDITNEVLQNERISVLYEISNAINSTENLDELFASIHKSLSRIIDTENFFIAIYEEEKGIISFPYLVDEMDDSIDPIDINAKGSMSAKVIREGVSHLYRKKEIDDFVSSADKIFGSVPLVWLGVPLKVQKKVIGAIVVQSYSNEYKYNEEDISLLRSVSDQIALAIDRKKTLLSLHFQYYFLQRLIDTIPMPIFYKDINDRKYIGCNKAFENLVGMSRDQILGKTVFDLFDDELSILYNQHDDLSLTDGGIQLYEGYVKDNSGLLKNVMIYKSGFNDEYGKLAGIVGVSIDITERKKYEEELYYQSTRDSALAELSKTIISIENLEQISNILINQSLRLTNSSIGLIAHYDEKSNELITSAFIDQSASNKKLSTLIFKPSNFDGSWYNLFTNFETLYINTEMKFPLHNHNVNDVESSHSNNLILKNIIVVPFTTSNKSKGIFAVANPKQEYNKKDIETIERISSLYSIAEQRIKADQEIRIALGKEQELSELKSRFILMVSHEYRTPLSAIILSTELLEEYGEKLTPEERTKHYTRIKQSIYAMTKLIDDIIMFNKMDIGIITFQPDFINIKSFALSLIYEIQVLHKDRCKIDFSFSGENIEVYIDEKLVRQILTNLLTNAIKYSHEGDHILFDIKLNATELQFIIQDYGIGIPENDKKNIFQPFHRGSNIGTTSGTGLGLSIVKNALDLHNGKIDFESKVGQGTKFAVTIPINKTRITSNVFSDF